MPEYVYALHDFTPENPDEVPFKAGDKIEVIEKDEQYQDGWWQGRNPEGRVGLFPQSYTTTKPPAPSPPVEPVKLPPISFPETSIPPSAGDPKASSPNGSNDERERTLSQGERTMQATLTDVQKAIEQLGRTGGDAASFSFASSHGDYTDREETETEGGESEDEAGTGWHRSARERLALRAQQENEERQAREGSTSVPTTPLRVTQPPIDVEVSDESEDEEEADNRFAPRRRSGGASPEKHYSSQYPHIPEEDEAAEEVEAALKTPSATQTASESNRDATIIPSLPSAAFTPPAAVASHVERDSVHIEPSEDFIVPSPSISQPLAEMDDGPPTATANRSTFPDMALTNSPDPSSLPGTAPSTAPNTNATPTPIPPAAPPPASMPELLPPVVPEEVQESSMPGQLNPLSPLTPDNIAILPAPIPLHAAVAAASPHSATASSGRPTPSAIKVQESTPFISRSTIPSPGRASAPSPGLPMPSPTASSATGSVGFGSQSGIQQTLTPATTMSFRSPGGSTPQREGSPAGSQDYRRPATHPSEWSLEEVIDWLKAKGFDQGVCDKFIEQEITGDVLLDLDANVLKTEFGIAAFGKRVRIMNAIAELRRPPSFNDDPHAMSALSGSRSQSLNYGHSHSSSMASSAHQSYANSPLGYGFGSGFSPASQKGLGSSATIGSNGLGSLESPRYMPVPELPSSAGSFARNGWSSSDPGSAGFPPAASSEINLSTPRMGETHTLVPSDSMPQPSALVGLGLGLTNSYPGTRPESPEKPAAQKGRPSNLVLSSSDVNLKVKAIGGDETEERTTMSDSETTQLDQKAKRRRLFGRSAESASIKEKASSLRDNSSRHSKESTPVVAIDPSKPGGTEEVAPTRRTSRKKSSEERKPSDRLSLFGGSLSGTLGKGRKPVPKLSISEKQEKHDREKGDHESLVASTFQRMRHPSGRKHSSRPSTSDGVALREKEKMLERDSEPEKEKNRPSPSLREKSSKDPAVLRKRTSSTSDVAARSPAFAAQAAGAPPIRPGKSVLEQIGTSDHNGWMRKKNDQFNSWRMRYFVLKGPHLYILKSNDKSETKIKGYVNILGYRVVADENIDPGRYGFRLIHDSDKTHYFSHDEQLIIREWMKALMKATISRDFTNPVVSSSNIPTISLTVAQAMNPSPRPPSPSARAATQRAHRRDNPNQLSSRDAQILMGMAGKDKPTANGDGERPRLDSFFTSNVASASPSEPPATKKVTSSSSKSSVAPPRPSRETRRKFSTASQSTLDNTTVDAGLIEWANSHLSDNLKITDPSGPLCSGLALLRLAEDIKGKPSSPPVPDSAFPTGPNDDRLDGLFRLFDFLLDNDVKMGTVSINDIRQGKREKVAQLLNSLKNWEEKRKAIALSIDQTIGMSGTSFMAGPVPYFPN